MTLMLVVVDSPDEAAVAIEGGADRVVVRLARQGLPLDVTSLQQIGDTAQGRCPVAVWSRGGAASEPPVQAARDACRADEVFLPSGAHAAPGGDRGASRNVAVLPFSSTVQESVFETCAVQGFGGILFGEGLQPRRLLHGVSIGHLQQQVRWARSRKMTSGFAGTMEAPDIPRLLAVEPDVLVFDDTVRQEGMASGALNPERLRFVRELIPRAGAADTAPLPGAPGEIAGRDRIFVRDWTMSIHIGAYEHERVAQRVRFTVEVEVLRTTDRASDLRHIVTYDLITDAISIATVSHVELVETVAEDVASAILAHPRTVSVDITIEKLDLGPGSLGCRILRTRDRQA